MTRTVEGWVGVGGRHMGGGVREIFVFNDTPEGPTAPGVAGIVG